MVGGGDDASHNHGVDKATCDGTPRLGKDDGEGTGGGIAFGKIRVVVRDVEANDDDRDDVE